MKMIKIALLSTAILLLFYGQVDSNPDAAMSSIDINLAQYDKVFINWLPFNPEEWITHNYRNEEDWVRQIMRFNAIFKLEMKKKWSADQPLVFAEDKENKKPEGKILEVQFSDIFVDYDNYYLYISIKIVDPQIDKILFSVKKKGFFGDTWGFENYIIYAVKVMAGFLNNTLQN